VSVEFYRAIMMCCEGRRLEQGLSMAEVDRISGVQEGHYAKLIYPDTPSGRQGRYETVQLIIEALFGTGFLMQITPSDAENGRLRTALRIDKGIAANALQIRHWRHKRHFRTLGAAGGKARNQNLTEAERSALARKLNRKRWRAYRKAKRQGEAHKKSNSEKQAAAMPAPTSAKSGQLEKAL
jgi:hypothetical protein